MTCRHLPPGTAARLAGPGYKPNLVLPAAHPEHNRHSLQPATAAARDCDPAVGPSHWTFWLVGSEPRDEIGSELKQKDREWGHISKADNYDIRVTTWGRLLDQAERRFAFYRKQLSYNVSQEEAVQRVRQRHRELLPPE